MHNAKSDKQPTVLLEENLKKALTEMLLLSMLAKEDHYISELAEMIRKKSGGVLNIVFPYSAIYRLQQAKYIYEKEKRNAPDGRRRQYYAITENGRKYLEQLLEVYTRFSEGVMSVLKERG